MDPSRPTTVLTAKVTSVVCCNDKYPVVESLHLCKFQNCDEPVIEGQPLAPKSVTVPTFAYPPPDTPTVCNYCIRHTTTI